MATYNLSQIGNIITKRPNKNRIAAAQKLNKKMMLHLHGVGMPNALRRLDYFENSDIYKARRDYAVSNVDLFERVLREEEQVFSVKGGSQYFNLPDAEEKQMNILLSDVAYGQSLHKWVYNFGLNAYRADPEGVIFMEVEKVTDIEGADDAIAGAKQTIETPKCYPVYKCIQDIWDYQSNGQRLDYICFSLNVDELEMYGIEQKSESVYPTPDGQQPIQKKYFRWVDDGQDVIVSRAAAGPAGTAEQPINKVDIVQLGNGYKNPINGLWKRVPAFVISDLIKFSSPGSFDTPLNKVIELADCFLKDRSVRDLQIKYHGFAKAVEPLTTCITCGGEGYVKGVACPECTVPGQNKGTGYKLQTKIQDVLKIPLDMLNADKAPRFDFKKIFGYVTPDIESWNKQDDNLSKLENAIYITYWGCASATMQGYNGKQEQSDTATEVVADLQPKFARMNRTADWAEGALRMIADFIGEFWFAEQWKGASIQLSRDYIFETPDTILDTYYNMKANGVPDSMLDNQYEKYLKALWRSNPGQALIYQKKFDVEPFPHMSADDVEKSGFVLTEDKLRKRYFGEWDDTLTDPIWTFTDTTKLRALLLTYATDKATKLQGEQQAEFDKQMKLKTPAKQEL